MKLVLATRNAGKVRELTDMLHDAVKLEDSVTVGRGPPRRNVGISAGFPTGMSIVPRHDAKSPLLQICTLQDFPSAPEIIEDGETYAENACKKAEVIADYTGHLTLADDAGLEVAALSGAPGVQSKRWAGEDASDAMRIAKLLEALEGNPNRAARFVAAVAIAKPVPRTLATVERGTRADDSHADNPQVVIGVCEGHITLSPMGTGGFGYDPVFIPNGYDKTFAELGEERKNRISHRAKALQLALPLLFS